MSRLFMSKPPWGTCRGGELFGESCRVQCQDMRKLELEIKNARALVGQDLSTSRQLQLSLYLLKSRNCTSKTPH